MNYSFYELKKKTVIDVNNGKKLGKVSDITVNFSNCRLENLTVTPNFKTLFTQEKIVISPCDIQRIGEDAILVKSPRPSLNDLCKNDLGDDDE